MVTNCNSNGGYVVKQVIGAYSVCSPVWSIRTTGQKPTYHEPAAFNAMLTRNGTGQALVMHQRDRVSIHFFVTSAKDGWHIAVSDLTTGQSGTIVLNSASGPLMPAFSVQRLGNSLGWGLVHDAPASFVWEIGHTSQFTSPAAAFCAGCGQPVIYDAPAWADQGPPIKIQSVTFKNGAKPTGWAVVSDYGGKAEVTDPTETGSTCTAYGGPFCIYPWFTQNRDGSFSYGVDYGLNGGRLRQGQPVPAVAALRRPVRPGFELDRATKIPLMLGCAAGAWAPAAHRQRVPLSQDSTSPSSRIAAATSSSLSA